MSDKEEILAEIEKMVSEPDQNAVEDSGNEEALKHITFGQFSLSPATTGQEIPTVRLTDADGTVTTATKPAPIVETTSTNKKIDVIINGARIKNPA